MKVFTGLPVDILTLHLLLNHGNHKIRVQTISLCGICSINKLNFPAKKKSVCLSIPCNFNGQFFYISLFKKKINDKEAYYHFGIVIWKIYKNNKLQSRNRSELTKIALSSRAAIGLNDYLYSGLKQIRKTCNLGKLHCIKIKIIRLKIDVFEFFFRMEQRQIKIFYVVLYSIFIHNLPWKGACRVKEKKINKTLILPLFITLFFHFYPIVISMLQ